MVRATKKQPADLTPPHANNYQHIVFSTFAVTSGNKSLRHLIEVGFLLFLSAAPISRFTSFCVSVVRLWSCSLSGLLPS